jgi:hypothetical protein
MSATNFLCCSTAIFLKIRPSEHVNDLPPESVADAKDMWNFTSIPVRVYYLSTVSP